MYLYLKNVVLRDSCFNCKFKGNNNVADLIIADYWGIEISNKEFFDANGVSACVINSAHGKEFFDKIDIKKYAYIEKGDFEDLEKYNSAYTHQVTCKVDRRKYVREICKKGLANEFDTIKKDILEKEYSNMIEEYSNLKSRNIELENTLRNIYNSKQNKNVKNTFK